MHSNDSYLKFIGGQLRIVEVSGNYSDKMLLGALAQG